jgi:hypothetical protein
MPALLSWTYAQAFVHTWNGYVKYAWGYDELKPVSTLLRVADC